jgi:hypothetical protein
MKKYSLLFILGLAGCISFTEQKLEYVKIASSTSTERYYISEVKFSEKAASIPVGEVGSVSERSAKIRSRLCENSGGAFTLNPEGAIPLKITLHAYKNVVPKNMGIAKLDENGVSKNFMGLTRSKIWRLIYEIKCEIGVGDSQREITKNVNSDGCQIEGIIFPQVVFLFNVLFTDTMHFDGISPVYGMIDEYDWLLEKDFAEVVKSIVAEFALENE